MGLLCVKQRSISWGALPGLEAPRQTLTADIDVDGDHGDDSTTVSSTTASTTTTNDPDEAADERGIRSASLDRHLIITPPATPQRRPGKRLTSCVVPHTEKKYVA